MDRWASGTQSIPRTWRHSTNLRLLALPLKQGSLWPKLKACRTSNATRRRWKVSSSSCSEEIRTYNLHSKRWTSISMTMWITYMGRRRASKKPSPVGMRLLAEPAHAWVRLTMAKERITFRWLTIRNRMIVTMVTVLWIQTCPRALTRLCRSIACQTFLAIYKMRQPLRTHHPRTQVRSAWRRSSRDVWIVRITRSR